MWIGPGNTYINRRFTRMDANKTSLKRNIFVWYCTETSVQKELVSSVKRYLLSFDKVTPSQRNGNEPSSISNFSKGIFMKKVRRIKILNWLNDRNSKGEKCLKLLSTYFSFHGIKTKKKFNLKAKKIMKSFDEILRIEKLEFWIRNHFLF